jgi:short subunit dehydrogenase-like uncharacterized protein
MTGIIKSASRKDIRRVLGNPYALNPKDGVIGKDGGDQLSLKFDGISGKWTAPFLMAGSNTRVVRRSHALLGYPYGKDFRYSEVMGFPKGLKGWRMASSITIGLALFMGLLLNPITRIPLQRFFLPKPGEGPDRRSREGGFFTVDLLGLSEEGQLWCRVKDNLDPGYGSTSKMLAESAIALALQSEDLPQCYGCVTPATGIGQVLIDRLKEAGMQFTILN